MLIENLFSFLFKSKSFFDIVNPHLTEKYFADKEHSLVFQKIRDYNIEHHTVPSLSDVKLMIETDTNISEVDTERAYEFIETLKTTEAVSNETLLIRQVEQFCQDRALEIAVLDVVEIIQSKEDGKGKIREKIDKALAIEFDVKIGMDFFKSAPERYEMYIEEEEIIPTDIEVLNTLLNGGFRRKAIHGFLGRTNIGKTAILCHLAACMLKAGRNVIYVTGEMSEVMISKRIDGNMLDIAVNDLNKNLDKKVYLSKIMNIHEKTQGKLIVKEYPTGSANANHVKNLLNEIKSKRGFSADVLILDYLNIFGSYRQGASAASNSYNYIKGVTEEFRGLAVEFNLALITATQTNREGAGKTTDMGMDSVSESFGTAMTMDWLCGIIQTPEQFDARKYMFKNLKSRFGSNINQIVTTGVDYDKMKLINLSDAEQEVPQHIKDKLKYEQSKIDEKEQFDAFDFS